MKAIKLPKKENIVPVRWTKVCEYRAYITSIKVKYKNILFKIVIILLSLLYFIVTLHNYTISFTTLSESHKQSFFFFLLA